MQSAKSLENMIASEIKGIEGSLQVEAIQIAVLQTQIGSMDDTLYAFRDLAGRQLKSGSGELMSRYRNYKLKLDNLVKIFKNKTGIDLAKRLKCNR